MRQRRTSRYTVFLDKCEFNEKDYIIKDENKSLYNTDSITLRHVRAPVHPSWRKELALQMMMVVAMIAPTIFEYIF